jgi:hypothetical protein
MIGMGLLVAKPAVARNRPGWSIAAGRVGKPLKAQIGLAIRGDCDRFGCNQKLEGWNHGCSRVEAGRADGKTGDQRDAGRRRGDRRCRPFGHRHGRAHADDCPGSSYAILERREQIGGTWDLFRYPGIRSDSDMHTLGFIFEPWKHEKSIADGPAILEYLNRIADERGIARISASAPGAVRRLGQRAGAVDGGDRGRGRRPPADRPAAVPGFGLLRLRHRA